MLVFAIFRKKKIRLFYGDREHGSSVILQFINLKITWHFILVMSGESCLWCLWKTKAQTRLRSPIRTVMICIIIAKRIAYKMSGC